MKRLSGKNFSLQPKTMILIFLVLAALMFASALIELNQSKNELLELMENQAHNLLDTIITASANALLTYEHLEMFLDERLLNNAHFIRFLYENGNLSNKILTQLAEENNIHRIAIFSSDGSLIFRSFSAPQTSAGTRTTSEIDLSPIFFGQQDTMLIGYSESRNDSALRYIIAVAARDHSAIVLYLDAKDLLDFRKRIGFGSLMKDLSKNPGIIYVALQDSMGIIAASGNVSDLETIADSPFLSASLQDSSLFVHITKFNENEIFEAVHQFYFEDYPIGLFRLGLSLEPLNQIKVRIYRRIGIISIVLLIIGFVVFTFLVVRQNYNLLERQYQVVETYSSGIIRTVSDAVIVLNQIREIKIFNQAAEKIFEVRERDVIGKFLSSILNKADSERVMLFGVVMEQIECEVENKKKYLLVSKGNFDDENGETNVVLVIRDLTEQHKLEAQIQRNERLSAMGELASGVAHEIRNPLNAIGTIVQQLDKDFEPGESEAEYHQLMRVVINEVHRINETIEDFLRFARPIPIRPEKFFLQDLINHLSQQYSAMLAERKIKFIVEMNWKGEVNWDHRQMQQVFMNLLQNAMDAIGKNGAINLTVNKSQNEEIEVLFKDTGAGIPAQILAKVFNLYFTTKAKGTGLGLSIVQRIIYEHSGIISVESEEGEGTTFLIQLPIYIEK